jgi:hypothetical protein
MRVRLGLVLLSYTTGTAFVAACHAHEQPWLLFVAFASNLAAAGDHHSTPTRGQHELQCDTSLGRISTDMRLQSLTLQI